MYGGGGRVKVLHSTIIILRKENSSELRGQVTIDIVWGTVANSIIFAPALLLLPHHGQGLKSDGPSSPWSLGPISQSSEMMSSYYL